MAVEVLSASSPEDREDLLAKLYSTLAGDIPDVFGDALAVHFLLLGQLFWSTHFRISFFLFFFFFLQSHAQYIWGILV